MINGGPFGARDSDAREGVRAEAPSGFRRLRSNEAGEV